MVHFIQQYSQVVHGKDHRHYVARVYAAQHPDRSRWDGWFVFFPLDGGRELATDRETTQSSLSAVAYWATAITTTYLEGALERARALLPERRLARHVQQAAQEEEMARAEAAAYAEAAAAARLEMRVAEQRRREAEELLVSERAVCAREAAELHERAAAAARAEAHEAERRTRRLEQSAPAERRYTHSRAGAVEQIARAEHRWGRRRTARSRRRS
jgi:hypothetical protein